MFVTMNRIPVNPEHAERFEENFRQWLGLYPTWEGLLAQVLAVGAVLGSYFLSEALKRRTLRAAQLS